MFFHCSSLFTVLYCWNSLFNASCFLIYSIGFSRSDVKISLNLNFVIKEFDSAGVKLNLLDYYLFQLSGTILKSVNIFETVNIGCENTLVIKLITSLITIIRHRSRQALDKEYFLYAHKFKRPNILY